MKEVAGQWVHQRRLDDRINFLTAKLGSQPGAGKDRVTSMSSHFQRHAELALDALADLADHSVDNVLCNHIVNVIKYDNVVAKAVQQFRPLNVLEVLFDRILDMAIERLIH